MLQKTLELVLVPLLRMLLHIFFRQIEVTGVEKVEEDVPVIYTPNHPNSVLDGFLARAFLPRDPRPLAKATLWDITVLRPILLAIHAIPVYRQQDSTDPAYANRNEDSFSSCHDALGEKSCIVVFPEGQSHSEPKLQPLKTGAARIALGAEQKHGPLGVRIIPVGINFDAKQKFRSRVLIAIGDAVEPMLHASAAEPEDRDAVNELTDLIQAAIERVTINYPSWEEAHIMQRAAQIYASQRMDDSPEARISDEFSVQKQVADAYQQLKDIQHRRVERVVDAVNAYDRLLRVLSIRHEHVIQEHPRLLQAIFSLRKLSLFLIRLPLALLGIFLNAVPYYLTRLVSRARIPEDRASTVKLVCGIFLFPLCWTLQANYLGTGILPAWVWWLLAPLSGISTLLFRERHNQLLDELRTYLRLNTHAEMREELHQRLANVDSEVAELLEVATLYKSREAPLT